MQSTTYAHQITVPCSYERALELITEALREQGFGILTSIDVQQTLKAKLDAEFRPYTILGACNPPLAKRALESDLDVGILLPCNVVVYETDPRSSCIVAMAPLGALGLMGDEGELREVATEAEERLKKALEEVERSS